MQVRAFNGREALDQEIGCKLPLRNFIADGHRYVVDALSNGTLAAALW